jgi:holo-[acyl-carrier protein] synthase
MVFGIGIDMIEVERVAGKIQKPDFLERVFSKGEIEFCENNPIKEERYAARFAAKEAFFKALGTGWMGQFTFNEVEVVNDEMGKPFIKLHGAVAEWVTEKGIKKIFLSMSHLKSMASAVVVLEI